MAATGRLAFTTAKRARTDTRIGANPVSVASAAVRLAQESFARLEDSTHNVLARNHFSKANAHGTTGSVKLVRSHLNRIVENSFDDGHDNLVIQ